MRTHITDYITIKDKRSGDCQVVIVSVFDDGAKCQTECEVIANAITHLEDAITFALAAAKKRNIIVAGIATGDAPEMQPMENGFAAAGLVPNGGYAHGELVPPIDLTRAEIDEICDRR